MFKQTKCLNILQRLRGTILPGYVSLFQRLSSDASERICTKKKSMYNEEDDHDEDYFDEILNSLEKHPDPETGIRKKRLVNTVWQTR